MGKGIALQFKQAYPGNFRVYEAACRRGEVQLGKMFTYDTGLLGNPRFVINFPTKGHWRAGSRLSDIKAGLDDLRRIIQPEAQHDEAVLIGDTEPSCLRRLPPGDELSPAHRGARALGRYRQATRQCLPPDQP